MELTNTNKLPWQVLSLEFIEELNRKSGIKWLQPYGPRPDDAWHYRQDTKKYPVTFDREISLKDGRRAVINRSAEIVKFTDGSLRPDPSMTCWVDGKVVAYAGDSFGATELFVVDSLHRQGIGSQLYKAYLETFGLWKCAGGFTGSGFETALATHRLFVEEAVAAGKPVPQEVLDEYDLAGSNGRRQLQRRPQLIEFLSVDESQFREVTEAIGVAYQPFREVSADMVGYALEGQPWALDSLKRNIKYAIEGELLQVDLNSVPGEIAFHFADKISLWAKFTADALQTGRRFDLFLFFYGEVDERWPTLVRGIFQRRTVRELVFRSLRKHPAESLAA